MYNRRLQGIAARHLSANGAQEQHHADWTGGLALPLGASWLDRRFVKELRVN